MVDNINQNTRAGLPMTAAEVATRDPQATANACVEAAAEIERLTADNERLRAALDTLVMACELPGDHYEVEQALPAARAALEGRDDA